MIRKNINVLTVMLLSLTLLLPGCGQQSGLYVTEQGENMPSDDFVLTEASQPETELSVDIYVQVSGAVKNPGVYCLPAESRVFEAVELAGGVTEDADLDSLNQALPLKDGQMIYVYAVGEERESVSGQTQNADDGRVDLNTATVDELMKLPGIGRSKAESIVSWREENGNFDSVEDIMNITGIKEGVFSKIKDYIKVN